MAAGCVPDTVPWDIPLIAHQAGFQSSGMWVDANTTWDKNALNKTKDSLKKTEIQLIDVEVTWLEDDDNLNDSHKLIIDVGLELSAKNILVVNRHNDYGKALNQFYKMCEYADKNIRVCLEFGEFTTVKSIRKAIDLLWNLRDIDLDRIQKHTLPTYPYELEDGRQVLIMKESFKEFALNKRILDF